MKRIRKILNQLNTNLSGYTAIGLIIMVFAVNIHNDKIHHKRGIIDSDVKGYYTYLPALIIYNDLHLDYPFKEENKPFAFHKFWFLTTENGNRIIQYTCGLAILYSPFFFIAHAITPLTSFPPNGYSIPYLIAIQFASLFYFILAIFLLRRLLREYFSELVTAITLIAVVAGTNLYYYLSYESALSHPFSFSFVVYFIYLLDRWLKKPRIWKAVLLGLVTGMIILIRPTDIIIILLFLFWNVWGWKEIRERLNLLLKKSPHILLMVLFALLIWVPQFLYWKYISGSYLYFSYGERAHFFWGEPEIINVLFSYRKGWFLYTPIMLLAVIGIFLSFRFHKRFAWGPLLVTVLIVYISSAWCFWWVGGSFGHRAFIDFYGLLSIPLAVLISQILKRKHILRTSGLLIIAFFVLLNVFQTMQYLRGIIHYVSMTKEAYWSSFMSFKTDKEYWDLMEYPDYEGVEQRIRDAKAKKDSD